MEGQVEKFSNMSGALIAKDSYAQQLQVSQNVTMVQWSQAAGANVVISKMLQQRVREMLSKLSLRTDNQDAVFQTLKQNKDTVKQMEQLLSNFQQKIIQSESSTEAIKQKIYKIYCKLRQFIDEVNADYQYDSMFKGEIISLEGVTTELETQLKEAQIIANDIQQTTMEAMHSKEPGQGELEQILAEFEECQNLLSSTQSKLKIETEKFKRIDQQTQQIHNQLELIDKNITNTEESITNHQDLVKKTNEAICEEETKGIKAVQVVRAESVDDDAQQEYFKKQMNTEREAFDAHIGVLRKKLRDLEIDLCSVNDDQDRGDLTRQGLHFIFLIDQSTSMNDCEKKGGFLQRGTTKTDMLRESLKQFMQQQSQYKLDVMSVIPFHNVAQTLVKSENLSYDFKKLVQQMDAFKFGGTNISAAIDESIKVIQQEKKRNIIVLLLTDGYETVGDSGKSAKAFNKIRQQIAKQLYFFSMGIGAGFDKALLQKIAYEANDQQDCLKVEDTELAQFLIEDSDLTKDWPRVIAGLASLTSQKQEILKQKIVEVKSRLESISKTKASIIEQIADGARIEKAAFEKISQLGEQADNIRRQQQIAELKKKKQYFENLIFEETENLRKFQQEKIELSGQIPGPEQVAMQRQQVDDAKQDWDEKNARFKNLKKDINLINQKHKQTGLNEGQQSELFQAINILRSQFQIMKPKLTENIEFLKLILEQTKSIGPSLKDLQSVKDTLTFSETIDVLLDIVQSGDNQELKQLVKTKNDFDDPQKEIEFFSYFNGISGNDREHFHQILKVIHLRDLLQLEVPKVDPQLAENNCKDMIISVFTKQKSECETRQNSNRTEFIDKQNRLEQIDEDLKKAEQSFRKYKSQWIQEKDRLEQINKIVARLAKLKEDYEQDEAVLMVNAEENQRKLTNLKNDYKQDVKQLEQKLEELRSEGLIDLDQIIEDLEDATKQKNKLKAQKEILEKEIDDLKIEKTKIQKEKDAITSELEDKLKCLTYLLKRVRTSVFEKMTKHLHKKVVDQVSNVLTRIIDEFILKPMQQYAASKVEAAKYGDIGTLMIEY